jgi:O-antigen biosynthesis protein
MRICTFGAAPASADWLERLRIQATNVSVEPIDARDAVDALKIAAQKFAGDDLILVRTDIALPPFWLERLIPALKLPDVFVVSPLDNIDVDRSALPPGKNTNADAATIDALIYRYGRRESLQWPTFSTLLSAWRGAALQTLDIAQIHNSTIPASFAPLRAMLVGDLYVADPARPLRGPKLPKPGDDRLQPSALGELREASAQALTKPTSATYPGLDEKPVVLHVLHAWGGGAERFVRDLAATDAARHHLVFMARGNFERRHFGESLELRDGALSEPPLRQIDLSDPIASTRIAHRDYAEFLSQIIRDFSVDAIFVSSLIGHSLDALRTGLPTTYFVHDFYPLWPLLHRNLDDDTVTFDAKQLTADLATADAGFEFAERDPAHWLTLRDRLGDELIQLNATLIAPSQSALTLFVKLQPRIGVLAQRVIPHGTERWTTTTTLPLPAPPQRKRLRLIVLGRVRRGKAAAMLRDLIPRIREHAEIFLLGAGPESEEFFGWPDVHILLNYRRDELPTLLASVAPDASLILPNFAETFSYTLSELISFGIPVIATRLGALAERIHDGVDGFLVAPNPPDITALIARLDEDRTLLRSARNELARIPHRSLADMANDYADFLPTRNRRRDATGIGSSLDRIVAQTRAGELGDMRRESGKLERLIAEQQTELVRRGEWGFDLDAQLKRSAQSLALLNNEFDVRTRWALKLESDLNATLASTSWRVTRPLRGAVRLMRAMKARLLFNLARLRAIIHRTRGSLASRGLIGTMKRAADEFRNKPLPVAAVRIPEPTEDFSPFDVPFSDKPHVSIVIPVFNKIAYTAACLRSLAEHAEQIPFETIVVDDGSTDQTSKRLAQIGGIRVLRNENNLGFVGSCNAGAAMANGEFIIFLNNDTVVTAGWLKALIDCFDQEPDAGLVGSKLVYPDGRLQEAGGIVFRDGSGWNYGRFDNPADPRYNFRREADYCSGAAIMLRTAFFRGLGGFDQRYAPAYFEDTDLAFATRAMAKKVFFEPRSVVAHFEGVTAGTDVGSGMKRYQAINRDKFWEKWKMQLAAQPAPISDASLAERAANWRDRGHILIVDSYTPTPDQDSGSLRMLNLMRLLREFGYAVSFLADNRAHAGAYTQALQDLGVQALYHPFVADPIAWLHDHGRELTAVILSRHYVAANYIESVRAHAPQARLIFDTVDVHHLREQRAAELAASDDLSQQAARTRAQEIKVMRASDVTLVVSAAEKEILARYLPNVRIEILSNVHEIHGRRRDFDARRDLVFVGGFQHPPNVDAVLWFVREVFPIVRETLSDVTLHVIGSKAPPNILELAHDGVVVHGFVSDIAPYMDGCRLALAPLRYGAGVKGKVNMAMSYGLPVVATTPAVEGMHVRAGDDVLVADSPSDFAAAIVHGYSDATLWRKLSDNGLANVSRHFSFDAARESIKRVLDGTRR